MIKTAINTFVVLILASGLIACGGGDGETSNSSSPVSTSSLVLPQQLEVVTNETE
ncbi:hypothetical protein [Vibrio sp. HN007]|uniref:hypothetical protein n=1 Tax=Vibrio iocasae TaxID=3098914 RepID=UPI0035D3EE7E